MDWWTAWRICSINDWFPVFSKKKRSKFDQPGLPVHDDLWLGILLLPLRMSCS